MTKANANAAANAQEPQAAQQQILRDLLALGKKNGRLTLKEISDALSHLELSSEDIDKVYETLETMGIEVETNGVLEKVIGDDDDSFEPEEVEEVCWMSLDDCREAVCKGSIPNCISMEELEMLPRTFKY